MIRKRVLALTALLLLPPPPARAACTTDRQATIALQFDRGVITLPVEVNGITARFVLDTGAVRSMVTDAAVQRLGLARDPWAGTTLQGIGGINHRANANPRSISLGGVKLMRRTLNHDTSLTVAEFPSLDTGPLASDGLLGRDFLSLFDLDLDVPGRRLTLYSVSGCTGRFLPWDGDYTALSVTMPAANAIVLPVTLDGTPLTAMLDSFATSSLLAAPGIYKLRLTQTSLAGDPTGRLTGLGPRTVTAYRHRFSALTVGEDTVQTPDLWVEPIRLSPIVDMLLGADWLATRRVWISFTTSQLFVTDAQHRRD